MGVITVVGYLGLRRVSISSWFKSFLLSMCVDARESSTSSLSSGFVEDGAGLILCFELVDTFGHFPRDFAGAALLIQSIFLGSVFKIWSTGATHVRI